MLVSPHRTERPWQGQTEDVSASTLLSYDPGCYLCPGNERAGGARTPTYEMTYVFDNDYPALLPDVAATSNGRSDLLVAEPERGVCRVICYSPSHDLTLGQMDLEAVHGVVDAWAEQYQELGDLDWVGHVQIFENRGSMMGASNPHPHGQVWAQQSLPNEAVKELAQQTAHLHDHGACLLCTYLDVELAAGDRIVCENDGFVVVVPYWAVWPFETLLVPRGHNGALTDLAGDDRRSLADVLGRLTRGYDRLFDVTFPYSMGLHQRPTDGAPHPEWHLHAHIFPPLLRSATVRKHMVGYELLAQP